MGEDRVAFNVACEYPDGTRVLAAENLDVCDGKIVRQVEVVAWDEQAHPLYSGPTFCAIYSATEALIDSRTL